MDSMHSAKPQEKKSAEKQKAGFVSSLMRGTAQSSGAGFGGIGGLGGRLLGGGMLATKAGVIGLILTASTVAGGLGLVGYKIFGPGASDRVGVHYSLFSPRPIQEQKAIEAQQKADNGNSASLDDLAKANPNALGD